MVAVINGGDGDAVDYEWRYLWINENWLLLRSCQNQDTWFNASI